MLVCELFCDLKVVLFSIYVNDIGNIWLIENTVLFVVDDTSLICKDLNLAKLDLQLNLTVKNIVQFYDESCLTA